MKPVYHGAAVGVILFVIYLVWVNGLIPIVDRIFLGPDPHVAEQGSTGFGIDRHHITLYGVEGDEATLYHDEGISYFQCREDRWYFVADYVPQELSKEYFNDEEDF